MTAPQTSRASLVSGWPAALTHVEVGESVGAVWIQYVGGFPVRSYCLKCILQCVRWSQVRRSLSVSIIHIFLRARPSHKTQSLTRDFARKTTIHMYHVTQQPGRYRSRIWDIMIMFYVIINVPVSQLFLDY